MEQEPSSKQESRGERVLRAINEEIENDTAAIKGMAVNEKRALIVGVLLAAVVVGVLVLIARW